MKRFKEERGQMHRNNFSDRVLLQKKKQSRQGT